jgi:hypothetical protein
MQKVKDFIHKRNLRTLEICLKAMKDNVITSQEKRQLQRRVDTWSSISSKKKILSMWRQQTMINQYKAKLYREAFTKWMKRQCFLYWKQYIMYKKKRKEQQDKADVHRSLVLNQIVFNAWKRYTLQMVHVKRLYCTISFICSTLTFQENQASSTDWLT